ncbi:MAG: hypothetical protein JNG89_00075 [Planctomycetaceae bacterium]|nr:hypothetical protein [Planctomycetaceae bacterium]
MSRIVPGRLFLLAPCCCLIALVLPTMTAADGPKHSLQYKFAADSALHYTVGNESTIDVQVSDTQEEVQHSSEAGRLLRTVSLNSNGSANLEVMIEYVNLSAGNSAISWDSRSGEPPPAQFQGIEKTVGRPLMIITVASTGEVIAAESDGKMADKSQLEAAQFDLLPLLPASPVAIGESWTEPFEVEVQTQAKLPRTISLQRLYTLRAIDNGIAEIDIRTNVLTPLQDPMEEGQLIQRTPSGTLRFDIARGRMLERIMKLDNKVVGWQGPQTTLHVVRTLQESLGSEEKAAANAAGPVTK